MEDNCFTVLCWFLLYNIVNHHSSLSLSLYIYVAPPSWAFLSPLLFRAVVGSQQNWEDDAEISHRPPVSTHVQPPTLSTSPPLVSLVRLLTIDELVLTHHQHHPKSIVYIRDRVWWYAQPLTLSALPLPLPPVSLVHLLQLVNLRWHIFSIQSP